MRWLNFFMLVMAWGTGAAALAQMPTYRLGRAPSAEEVRAVDLIVGPAGKELPPGKGTALEGAPIFAKRCAHCHGANGEGKGAFPRLVGGTLHPFATTVWSMIHSSMPRTLPEAAVREGTLRADEVYALTAFLLSKNGIIKETDLLDEKSLPRIHMPTRDRRLDKLAPR